MINQDDEDLNLYKGDEGQADKSKEVATSEGQSPLRTSSPIESVAQDELTKEHILGELNKIPFPDDIYTQEDFGGEPIFPLSKETGAPVGEKEVTQTSLTSGPGPFQKRGFHGMHKTHAPFIITLFCYCGS